MNKDYKIKTEIFDRIKVEDTKIIDKSILDQIASTDYNHEQLSKLTIDELTYVLEHEADDKKTISLIKDLIKQKRK